MFVTSIVILYNIYFICFTKVSIPAVSISVTAPNMPKVSQPLMLECEVITVRGVSSSVDIVWSSNGTVLRRLNGTTATSINNSQVYSDYYTIKLLRTSDKGRVIQCEGIIQATPSISNTNHFTLLDFTGQCILVIVLNMNIAMF